MSSFRYGAVIALAVGALVGLSTKALADPDIVVLLVDDLGSTFIGPEKRSVAVTTPNIDSIGAAGMTFTNAYAQPVCIPARAMLLTGKWPQRKSVGSILGNGPQPPTTIVTLAEYLRVQGYQTAAIGKWHLGFTTSQHPLSQGFDSFVGFKGITPDYVGHDPEAPLYIGRTPVRNTGNVTNRLVNEAIKVVTAPRTKPLFLYLPFTGVHDPLQGTLGERLKELDNNIGRLLAVLKPDTLIFYAGDNGRSSGSNKPFKGGKYDIWEGGVRVPFTLRWGPVVPAGQRVDTPTSIIDIAVTALRAAGSNALDTADGYDLLTPVPADRPVFFKALTPDPGVAVRQGPWKLYLNYKGVATQLYNVTTDKGEVNNVAAGNPAVVASMRALLGQFTAALND